MVEAAESVGDQGVQRAMDRAVGSLGRLAGSVYGVQRAQARHIELLLELSDEIDALLNERDSALAT